MRRALATCATVVLAVSSLLACGSKGSTIFSSESSDPFASDRANTSARPSSFVIYELGSTLDVPITTYYVRVQDSGQGELSYSWAMTATSVPDGECGMPRVPWTKTILSKPSDFGYGFGGDTQVQWSHAMGPPDLCPHLSTDHPVKTEVTITVLTGPNKGVFATCELLGSETQKITSPGSACRYSF